MHLDRRDAHILTLLSDGRSDATIARQSGVSLRTVERRVHALMDRLGAKTRFQAGAQAARRGWI
jgi:Response regulator containing a CheY-like receiver domain and an HTH DNA-binding domain